KDVKQGVEWYRKAAAHWYPETQVKEAPYKLGEYFFYVEKDVQEAVKWYRKAAVEGHASAQDALASRYLCDENENQDTKQREERSRKNEKEKAIEKEVGARGWRATSGKLIVMDGVDGTTFIDDDTEEVSKEDKEDMEWYRKAAPKGHVFAQYMLGECYFKGKGVDKDAKQAVEWFRKAAEQGHAEAQYSLGYCYFYGEGVEKDAKQAMEWFGKAAEQEYPAAQEKLARYLY